MVSSRKQAKPTHNERVRAASKKRREDEKRELRETILQTAAELFIETPNGDFSLRQVAERIGYSATTIYLYFKDKDELLFAICDQGFSVFDEALTSAYQKETNPLLRITEMGRAYIRFGLAYPAHYHVMFQDRREYLLSSRTGESKPRVASLMLLQRAVQEGLDAGVLYGNNAQSTADTLWAAVHGVVQFGNNNPLFDVRRTETLLEEMLALLLRGMSR